MSHDAHDTAVKVRIDRFIMKVNAEQPTLTVALKLEIAWGLNIREREEDSTNIIGRDADCYFAARHELAASNSWAAKMVKGDVGKVAILVYNGLKQSADLIEKVTGNDWLQRQLRTDPDKPNAPAGGYDWMKAGIADAMNDIGDQVADVKLCTLPQPEPEPRPSAYRRGTT